MLLMFPCCSFTLWDLFLVIGLPLIGMVVFSCLVGVIAGALIPGASKLGGGLLGLLLGATAVGLAVWAAFAGLGGADDGGWSLAVLAMIFYGVGAFLTVSVQLLLWGLRPSGYWRPYWGASGDHLGSLRHVCDYERAGLVSGCLYGLGIVEFC